MKPFSLFIIIVTLISCKKYDSNGPQESETDVFISEEFTDQEMNTSDYLMAKPGSWWTYSNGETWICEDKDTVPVFNFDYESLGIIFIIKDRIIAPKHPFFGFHKERYGVLNEWYHDETIFQPIYDTLVGQFYSYQKYVNSGVCSSRHTITETRKVLERLDSIEVNGQTYFDVLHVRHKTRRYYHCKGYGYAPDDIVEFYLAKNVGLIKFSQFNQPGLADVTLAEHYIEQ